jgi:ATP-dependent exoDNAse (exonuclease V) beta subunit
MEYDAVQIVNDFITEDKLQKLNENKENIISVNKLNEEINLLYVAVTRTKNSIYIPETLIPQEFIRSSQIHITKVLSKEEKATLATSKQSVQTNKKTEKKYSYEKVREKHKKAYSPWTEENDTELTVMYCEDVSIRDMANHFGRTKAAIQSRIKKLELKELYG